MFDEVFEVLLVLSLSKDKEFQKDFSKNIQRIAAETLKEHYGDANVNDRQGPVQSIINDLSNKKISTVDAIRLLAKQGHFNAGVKEDGKILSKVTTKSRKPSFNSKFLYNLLEYCVSELYNNPQTTSILKDNKFAFMQRVKPFFIKFLLNVFPDNQQRVDPNLIIERPPLNSIVIANAIAILHSQDLEIFRKILLSSAKEALTEFEGGSIVSYAYSWSENYTERCKEVRTIIDQLSTNEISAQEAYLSLCYAGGMDPKSYNRTFLKHLTCQVFEELGLSRYKSKDVNQLIEDRCHQIVQYGEMMVGSKLVAKQRNLPGGVFQESTKAVGKTKANMFSSPDPVMNLHDGIFQLQSAKAVLQQQAQPTSPFALEDSKGKKKFLSHSLDG